MASRIDLPNGQKSRKLPETAMSLYKAYLKEIEVRKAQGLHPKPIEDGSLTKEIILQIKDLDHKDRSDSLSHLIYNTLPGTTRAAWG